MNSSVEWTEAENFSAGLFLARIQAFLSRDTWLQMANYCFNFSVAQIYAEMSHWICSLLRLWSVWFNLESCALSAKPFSRQQLSRLSNQWPRVWWSCAHFTEMITHRIDKNCSLKSTGQKSQRIWQRNVKKCQVFPGEISSTDLSVTSWVQLS